MIQVLRNIDGLLEVEEEGRKYKGVKLIRTFPLTMPNQYISVRSVTDEEITMIVDLSILEESSRIEAEQELQRYYMTPMIEQIISVERVRNEWLWVVETNDERITFRMDERHVSIHPLSLVSWVLSDIEGRRFMISNIQELDVNSLMQWKIINDECFNSIAIEP